MSVTITIPWDGGTMTFNRDRLETAILHTYDLEAQWADSPSVVRTLRDTYRIDHSEAIALAAAARVTTRTLLAEQRQQTA